MNDSGHFIKAMLKNPLGVGAVAPSSRELAQVMIEGIEPAADSMILELGVGTGAITGSIAEILPDNNSYLGVEVDESLISLVQEKFPDLNLVHCDACKVHELRKSLQLGTVSYILSGIPFVSLPKQICESILAEVDLFMQDGCLFRTFQYVHGYYSPPARRFRSLMDGKYGPMKKSPVVYKNLPPAVVLSWQT